MLTRYGGGERFKKAREVIGITQKDLAAVLNVSPAYLSLISTGRQPVSEPIALKMQQKYGISARWLLFGIGDIFGSKLTRLRFVRDELGLSQKEMASSLGISAQYLGLMERGDQPISLPVAQNVEKLYGYRAEWILFEKGPMKL
ncbi:MAG: helix-turn-helix domain-containing protein [Blautia sp.]|nr:helix-turn-helix domain-containing protein [Blautia sp.]